MEEIPFCGNATLDGNVFAYERCQSFYYKCLNGIAVLLSCDKGNIYDSFSRSCNPPGSVEGCDEALQRDPCFNGTFPDGKLFLFAKCSKYYYKCAHGKTWKQQCSPGAIFDSSTGICGSVKNSECSDNQNCYQHSNGDLFIMDEGCYPFFYQCAEGIPYKISCPQGLIFDPNFRVCNWPEEVNGCLDGCNGHSNGELYINGDGCYPFYYHCIHGNSVKMYCSNELAFDPHLKVCNWKYSVLGCTKDDGCHGLKPRNCNPYFYQCVQGHEYKMQCPEGLIFDSVESICNLPSQVAGCKREPFSPGTISTSTELHWKTIKNGEVKLAKEHPVATSKLSEAKGKSYVGFTIDITGSMKTEIIALKKWLTMCIKSSRYFCGKAPSGGWVISMLKDPDFWLELGPTTDINSTIKTIDSIHPRGGWDCPEMAMSGIEVCRKKNHYEGNSAFLATDCF